jgi:hypothetical protein
MEKIKAKIDDDKHLNKKFPNSSSLLWRGVGVRPN